MAITVTALDRQTWSSIGKQSPNVPSTRDASQPASHPRESTPNTSTRQSVSLSSRNNTPKMKIRRKKASLGPGCPGRSSYPPEKETITRRNFSSSDVLVQAIGRRLVTSGSWFVNRRHSGSWFRGYWFVVRGSVGAPWAPPPIDLDIVVAIRRARRPPLWDGPTVAHCPSNAAAF